MSTLDRNRACRVQRIAALMAMVTLFGGCELSLPRWNPDGWLADFDKAERLVTESRQEMLILYVRGDRGRTSTLRESFDSGSLAGMVDGKVRCVLSREYEPDRRYVAQYGVDRAPAVILVHRDGTYHARTGPMTPDDLESFLGSAKPPGATTVYNPHIPRRAQYQWQDAIKPAMALATREGKPLLIVYHRRMSRDWARLKKLLQRHEVWSRLDDAVHCRIALPGFSRETAITPFGALHLPALVIVRTDGKHNVLELPTSYEAVALFADQTLAAKAQRTSTQERTSMLRGADATKP